MLKLYNSNFDGGLTATLEEQLAWIYWPVTKYHSLMVTSVPIQQQVGAVDCGLFTFHNDTDKAEQHHG